MRDSNSLIKYSPTQWRYGMELWDTCRTQYSFGLKEGFHRIQRCVMHSLHLKIGFRGNPTNNKKKLIKLYRNKHPDICVVSIEDIDWSLDPITKGLFLCEMQQTRSSTAALSPMPGSINLLLCLYGHADVGVWSASNSIPPQDPFQQTSGDVWRCLMMRPHKKTVAI